MQTKWSDKVRQIAERDFVEPARGSGGTVKIKFSELKAKLLPIGFPQGHANQVFSPLESAKFWKPLKLEMCSPAGLPRTMNSVIEFRFSDGGRNVASQAESPAQKARRLCKELRSAMREQIEAHGGAENFMRWVRSDEDEA